jgi:hypothetical protein
MHEPARARRAALVWLLLLFMVESASDTVVSLAKGEGIMNTNLVTTTSLTPRTARERIRLLLRVLLATTIAANVMVADVGARTSRAAQAPEPLALERTFPFPISLLQEHAELQTALDTAADLPGETGKAARRVLTLVTPLFKDEQRYVHPLLNLLPMLGKRQLEPWMSELLPLADRLPNEIDELSGVDIVIGNALDELNIAAWREGHPEYAFLADRIRRHNRMEEEIFYPAALVVGDYLRLKCPPAITASTR